MDSWGVMAVWHCVSKVPSANINLENGWIVDNRSSLAGQVVGCDDLGHEPPAKGSEATPMKHPWNLGVKVGDLDADLAFLERCGATQIQKGTIPTAKGDEAFGMALLGEQRLLLFSRVIYEDALPQPLKPGLAHVVFQVDDVEDVIERYR